MARMQIRIQDQEKANQFLRALWAEIRLRDPSCVWLYSPRRDGKQKYVAFGFLHLINQTERIYVGITYERRGGIESIFLDHLGDESAEIHFRIEAILYQALEAASKNYEMPCLFTVTGCLDSQHQILLAEYSGDRFSIKNDLQSDTSKLTISVFGYDDLDALVTYVKIAHKVLHFLSIETNVSFRLGSVTIGTEKDLEVSHENKYFEDADWLDGWPRKDNLLYISKEGVQFIEWIASCAQNDIQVREKFLSACKHFYTAREISSEETITVLCVSALEVASNLHNIKAVPCQSCGQPIYKISQRVTDLVAKFLPSHIVKFFKEYYGKRSKYLHEGIILRDQSFYHFGKNIPQLNKDSEYGCEVHNQLSVINLWEYTSYCLRCLLKRDVTHQQSASVYVDA